MSVWAYELGLFVLRVYMCVCESPFRNHSPHALCNGIDNGGGVARGDHNTQSIGLWHRLYQQQVFAKGYPTFRFVEFCLLSAT